MMNAMMLTSSVCKFLLANSPGRSGEEVDVVSGDGLFSWQSLPTLGFPNASFVADWFHLFNFGLLDRFGSHGFSLLEVHLFQMINTKSERFFDSALSNARTTLQNETIQDNKLMAKLEQFSLEKETYAQFYLDKIRGTQSLCGSTASEQNHSSALRDLNNGERSQNKYCEQPMTLAKDLFERQDVHVHRWNKALYD